RENACLVRTLCRHAGVGAVFLDARKIDGKPGVFRKVGVDVCAVRVGSVIQVGNAAILVQDSKGGVIANVFGAPGYRKGMSLHGCVIAQYFVVPVYIGVSIRAGVIPVFLNVLGRIRELLWGEVRIIIPLRFVI